MYVEISSANVKKTLRLLVIWDRWKGVFSPITFVLQKGVFSPVTVALRKGHTNKKPLVY